MQTTPPLVQKFLNFLLLERRLSKNTATSYASTLSAFVAGVPRPPEQTADDMLLQCGVRALKDFLGQQYEKGNSNATRNAAICALRCFWKWCVRCKFRSDNPADGMRSLKKTRRLPKFLDEAQAVRLIESPTGDDLASLRDRAILESLYSTGLRASELVDLEIADIDFQSGVVRIDRGKGAKDRIVAIGQHATDAIQKYLAVRCEGPSRVFLNLRNFPLSARSLRRMLKEYLPADFDPSVSPHWLRHSFATHLLDHGADLLTVRDLLGHASVSSTMIYTHVSIPRMTGVESRQCSRVAAKVDPTSTLWALSRASNSRLDSIAACL